MKSHYSFSDKICRILSGIIKKMDFNLYKDKLSAYSYGKIIWIMLKYHGSI